MARIEDTYARDHAEKTLRDMTFRQAGFAIGASLFLYGVIIASIDLLFGRSWT